MYICTVNVNGNAAVTLKFKQGHWNCHGSVKLYNIYGTYHDANLEFEMNTWIASEKKPMLYF